MASLEEASERVEPIHAQAFFYVGLGYIAYYLVFDYRDPLGYYERVVGDRELLKRELSMLRENMQSFLEEEEVVVNGERVRPRVVGVEVGFREKPARPFIVFTIRFPAPVAPGRNVYENKYASEPIEYNYEAYWVFPPATRIEEVEMRGEGEYWRILAPGLLGIYGRRGGRTGGYEKIVFTINP